MDEVRIKGLVDPFNIEKKTEVFRLEKRYYSNNDAEIINWTVPLSEAFDGEGTVTCMAHAKRDYSTIFSFVYYVDNILPNYTHAFRLTKYYTGLLIYAEMIQTMAEFEDFGMIIYTNNESLQLLQKTFGHYPKVILAVVNWPRYTINSETEKSILRTLRFHACEAFKGSFIAIRDADTFFTFEIEAAINFYRSGYKAIDESGQEIDDIIEFFIKKIGNWELEFIQMSPMPIVVGVANEYRSVWHKDVFLKYPVIKYKSYTGRHDYKERFGRFFNYDEVPLIQGAPFGVLAGLVNFLVQRPPDIWALCVDFLTTRISMLEMEPKRLNDAYLPTYIGKDERMILFAIMPKYLDLFFFFSSIYLNVGKIVKNIRVDFKSVNYNYFKAGGIDFFRLLTFRSDDGLFYNLDDKEYIIWSVMLDPRYVKIAYQLVDESGQLVSNKYKAAFAKMVDEHHGKLAAFFEFIDSNVNGEKLKNLTQKLLSMKKYENNDFYSKLLPHSFNAPIVPINKTRFKGGRRLRRRTVKKKRASK